MGEIISFEERRRAAPSRRQAIYDGAAQILFFTGVRYTTYIEPVKGARNARGVKKSAPERRRKTRKQA